MRYTRLIAAVVILAAALIGIAAAKEHHRTRRPPARDQDQTGVAKARAAAKEHPGDAVVRNDTGEILYRNGFRSEAIENWRAAGALRSDFAKPHINLGLAYFDRGNNELAITEFKDAVSRDANNADAHYNLGIIYSDNGDVEESVKEWKTAVSINPDHWEARQSLGDAYYNAGQLDKALIEYKKAIRVQPENEDLYYNYAFCLNDKRLYDDAVKAFQKYIDLSGKELEGTEEVQNCKKMIQEIKQRQQDEI